MVGELFWIVLLCRLLSRVWGVIYIFLIFLFLLRGRWDLWGFLVLNMQSCLLQKLGLVQKWVSSVRLVLRLIFFCNLCWVVVLGVLFLLINFVGVLSVLVFIVWWCWCISFILFFLLSSKIVIVLVWCMIFYLFFFSLSLMMWLLQMVLVVDMGGVQSGRVVWFVLVFFVYWQI